MWEERLGIRLVNGTLVLRLWLILVLGVVVLLRLWDRLNLMFVNVMRISLGNMSVWVLLTLTSCFIRVIILLDGVGSVVVIRNLIFGTILISGVILLLTPLGERGLLNLCLYMRVLRRIGLVEFVCCELRVNIMGHLNRCLMMLNLRSLLIVIFVVGLGCYVMRRFCRGHLMNYSLRNRL